MNEETIDCTPVAVNEVPKGNIVRNIQVMNDDTLTTLANNYDQWFRIFKYEGVDINKVTGTVNSSLTYWRNKLWRLNELELEFKVRRSKAEGTVEAYAKLSRKDNNATDTNR